MKRTMLSLMLLTWVSAACSSSHETPRYGPGRPPPPDSVRIDHIEPEPATQGELIELHGAFPGADNNTVVSISSRTPERISFSETLIAVRMPLLDSPYAAAASVRVRIYGTESNRYLLELVVPESDPGPGPLPDWHIQPGEDVFIARGADWLGDPIQFMFSGRPSPMISPAPAGFIVRVPSLTPDTIVEVTVQTSIGSYLVGSAYVEG